MQHEIPDHKICPNCNEDKPASAYHRNSARKDGLTYVCAICIPDYEAREKRPKRKLSAIQKTCKKCQRHLPARKYQYAQNTEDRLKPSCRTCMAYKAKKTPSIEEIEHYEYQMALIIHDAKNRFDLEKNRSELEQFVWKSMLREGLLTDWNPPVWIHKSSIPE